MIKKTKNDIVILKSLFLLFLILKLTDVINWSWWWVTSPLWIDLALVFFIIIVMVFLILLIEIFT